MEINEVLKLLAKELKENNKQYTNRKDRVGEKKNDFFIQKNLEQSQTKPKSKFGKDDKVISGILNDINNTISTVGLLTISSINKGFAEQNKLLKRIVKPSGSLITREKYDPLSVSKEQREEKTFAEEKRTNELLEDILSSLGGKLPKEKKPDSLFTGLTKDSLTIAGGIFAAGAIPAIGLGILNSFNKLIGTESTLYKLFKGGESGKPLFEMIKGSSFLARMTEFGKSLPLVNKITEAFAGTGVIGKGLRLGVGGLKVLAKAPLLELEAIFEGFKGLWQGEGWAEKFKLMSAGILGSIVGFPATLGNLVGDWLDIEWMKNLEFGKKDWWIEQIDAFRDGLSYSLGLKDPPKQLKPLEFQSPHREQQALQKSHGVQKTDNNKNDEDFEKRYAEYEGLVKEAAEKYGVSVDLMKTMMKVESGGDPLAKNKSGAKGLYQFVPSTAKAYGIVGQEFDPKANIDAAARLLRDNQNDLKARGLDATDFNLYMAHQQGAGGLNSLYKALESGKVTQEMQQNMESNIGIKGITPQRFMSFWQDKFAKEFATTNNNLTPIQEPSKTTAMVEAKKESFTSVNETPQPLAIGKVGNDITNIISNSTLNANFPYQSESKMKFAFGVA